MNADNYLYQLGWTSNSPGLINILSLNLVNLSIVFELFFAQQYLSLKTRLPFWNKVFNGMVYWAIFTIVSANLFYLSTKNFGDSIKYISLFQLGYMVFRPFAIVKIWQIKDVRIRIFAFAWTLSFLFSIAAWVSYYLFPAIPGLLFLKLAVGIYIPIVVISLSYYAAKTGREKLVLEKESIRQQLIAEQQRNQHLEIEKENKLLEVQTRELQKLNQLKSRFFANVSHELRTPLTLILGPLQSILRVKDPKEKDFELLSKMKSNGKNSIV